MWRATRRSGNVSGEGKFNGMIGSWSIWLEISVAAVVVDWKDVSSIDSALMLLSSISSGEVESGVSGTGESRPSRDSCADLAVPDTPDRVEFALSMGQYAQ